MQNLQIREESPTLSEQFYIRRDWQRSFQSLKQEFDYEIEDIEGTIPLELHGTLFRNGPGLFDINGQMIHHPFDGDGLINKISFYHGRAHFRNRFVRTQAYLEEQNSGKILYRGVFGTQKPGGLLANAFDCRYKNPANTNVIYWGGKLLALWEAGDPYRLDPHTLETLGKEHFNDVLSEGEAFGAHPCFDPSCAQDGGEPCLVNFSLKSGFSSAITVFEFNLQGALKRKHTHTVPGFTLIHDFVITPNYCIFFQHPVTFNPIPFVLGMCGVGQCMQFQPHQSTRIILIPRNPEQQKVQILETDSCFIFHHVNGFEVEDEIVIDSICYESLTKIGLENDLRQADFDTMKPGQLWRFSLNLKHKSVERKLLESRSCEFPSLHPQKVGCPYRYVYLSTTHAERGYAPLQALLKIDLQSGKQQIWSAAPRGFIGEPIFVPRNSGKIQTSEDDGWLLALVYDSARHRSDVVILDAQNLCQGPIARLHLKHHIPFGLHGTFVPQCFH